MPFLKPPRDTTLRGIILPCLKLKVMTRSSRLWVMTDELSSSLHEGEWDDFLELLSALRSLVMGSLPLVLRGQRWNATFPDTLR